MRVMKSSEPVLEYTPLQFVSSRHVPFILRHVRAHFLGIRVVASIIVATTTYVSSQLPASSIILAHQMFDEMCGIRPACCRSQLFTVILHPPRVPHLIAIFSICNV